ncbi:hypothetical protein CN155_10440 [Sinorhizobium meliloti]|uniref:hypothetical protein n=1 Tax=Rhizobium meliloti TaxID=382 RepID=UPI000FD851B3|nr:hypothetical protein [Sinorhizobium meliloti]MDE3795789.1 hypothetical protein [Sinorhizobium meliloti]RVK58278.1 hypothetical protein CN155_10440 [Sinorhizobium meliloti]
MTKILPNPWRSLVSADRCVTCHTIERSALRAPDVVAALGGIRLPSLVSALDVASSALMRSLAVIRPPTMTFFDDSDQNALDTRLVGEIRAASLADAARAEKGAAR